MEVDVSTFRMNCVCGCVEAIDCMQHPLPFLCSHNDDCDDDDDCDDNEFPSQLLLGLRTLGGMVR